MILEIATARTMMNGRTAPRGDFSINIVVAKGGEIFEEARGEWTIPHPESSRYRSERTQCDPFGSRQRK